MPGNSLIIKDYMNPLDERIRRVNSAKSSITGIVEGIKKRRQTTNYPNIPKKELIRTSLEYFGLDKFCLPQAFNTDRNCNGCGTCTKVCSVNNIQVQNKNVKWERNCHACLACFHWCPKESIQIGNYTSGKPRIHHPDISLKDMILK